MPQHAGTFSRQTLRSMWELLTPARSQSGSLMALVVIVQVMQLFSPYIFKEILDTITAPTGAKMAPLTWLFIGWAGLSLAISGIKYIRDRGVFRFLLTLERYLPVQAHTKLTNLSLGYHEQQDTGRQVSKVLRGTDRLIDLVANALFEFIPTLLQEIITFGLLFWLNWKIALVFLPVIPAFIAVTYWVNRAVRPMRSRRFEGYEQADGHMAQSLMNINVVQSFAQGPRELRRHSHIRSLVYRIESKEWRCILRINVLRETFINLGRLAVLVFSVWLLVHKEITIGTLVLFMTWAEQAYTSLFRMTRVFDRSAEWAEAIDRLNTLFHEPLLVSNAPDAEPCGTLTGRITFDHVSFAFNRGREALTDICLTIQPGETLALVGPSGSGKTTLTKLILRHYDPTGGSILFDGQNLRSLTMESFRHQMASVPQEVGMFNRTIRDNIAYGLPKATEGAIVAAADQSHASEFIAQLPHGFDTIIGEHGMKLSGGQRQRIGIARAILREPRILVLDEATSSLDSHSELLIQTALQHICRGRTTIIIAHRLSTVMEADRIVVMDAGRIVDIGKHADLLRTCDLYRHLHDLQFTETPKLTSPAFA